MGRLLLLAYCMLFSSIYRDYFVVAAKSMQDILVNALNNWNS